METNYLIILALLLGLMATTVPVFMSLFITGAVEETVRPRRRPSPA